MSGHDVSQYIFVSLADVDPVEQIQRKHFVTEVRGKRVRGVETGHA